MSTGNRRNKMTPKIDELIMAIGSAKKIARELNRFKTFHALDDAEKIAGWELADTLSKKIKRRKLARSRASNNEQCLQSAQAYGDALCELVSFTNRRMKT